MRLKSLVVTVGLVTACWFAPRAASAQMWTHGSYSVSSYVVRTTTGTGSSYTFSWATDGGIANTSAGSTSSSDSGSAEGEAIFAVTFTYYGGTPGTLTLQAEGDLSGTTNTAGGGTSSGWAYVGTDSAGALSNTQYTAPSFVYSALGIKTDLTGLASPWTAYITAWSQSQYAGDANTNTSSKVYFKQF